MVFVQTPILFLGIFCLCILAQASSADKSDKASLVSDAEDDRVKREPYYPYAYKGTSVSKSPASVASGSLGGAASQSKGTAIGGGGQRSKREPQRYGYGGYYGATSSANQQSNAMGGSGSTVVTSGTANASSG